MKNKRKYKYTSGIQQITPDTPNKDKLYDYQTKKVGEGQLVTNSLGALSGQYGGISQIAGTAGDLIKAKSKNKQSGTIAGSTLKGAGAGAAFGAKVGSIIPGLGTAVGAGVGATIGGTAGYFSGKKEVKETARLEKEAQQQADINNYAKSFNSDTSTGAQAALAKKGKYKVKTKQPRMIETEGREPIFSPKKADGTRDLLYYNPNDPTHEEGGVKAMVIPKAQGGKQKLKAKPKPVPKEEYTPLEDDDSILEEIAEIGDPTGMLSYDDVYRSAHNLINNKDRNASDYIDLGINVVGALPGIGVGGRAVKLAKTAFKYLDKGADAGKIIERANRIKRASQAIVDSKNKDGALKTLKKWGRTIKVGDRIGDAQNVYGLAKEPALFENPEWDRTHSLKNAKFLGRKIFPNVSNENMYPLGAKQLKVNELNNTAFSQHLANTTPANAPNVFIQPTAGINQVARQIPQKRRQEKINTKRSHRKENPDTNRVITPPTRFDDRPKPEKSHSKKVKVYR